MKLFSNFKQYVKYKNNNIIIQINFSKIYLLKHYKSLGDKTFAVNLNNYLINKNLFLITTRFVKTVNQKKKIMY